MRNVAMLATLGIFLSATLILPAPTTATGALDEVQALVESVLADDVQASAIFTGKKFYIDPGHGGTDPGACPSPGTYRCEETWVLDTGIRLRDILTANGAGVMMSRTTDTSKSVSTRASEANNYGANRYISIHLNSNSGTPGTGTEILICGTNSNTVAMANTMGSQTTSHMGTVLRSGSPKQRCDLTVLSATSMSANLNEVAFVNNNNDWLKIDSTTERQSAACAMAHTLSLHYGLASPCTH